jgi:fatty acid desaturase
MNTPAAEEVGVAAEVPTNFREALGKVGLTADELKQLGRLEYATPVVDLLVTVALMAAIPVIYRWLPNPITFVFCILLALHCFSRFAQLVHGSDHGCLFPNATANRWIGNLCAYVMGYTRIGHRTAHQSHHSFLNTEKDADRVWGRPDEEAHEMARTLVQDLFLMSAAKRLFQYSQTDRKSYGASPWGSVNLATLWQIVRIQLPVIPVQAALFAYYWLVIGPQFYVLLYLLPLLAIYPAIIRVRSTVEHGFPVGYRPESQDQVWVVRSTRPNLLERLVVAPLDGHLHFEHHLLPGAPYYNLREANRIIEARGMKIPKANGYLRFVVEKWRQEAELHRAAAAGSR